MTASQLRKDRAVWHCHTRVEKFEDNVHHAQFLRGRAKPLDTVEIDGNVLLNAGITLLWGLVTGGTTPAMSSGHCRLGVGIDTTAAAAAQTQLNIPNASAATSVLYKASGLVVSLNTSTPKGLQVAATFGTSDANFAWNEWGVEYVGGTPADGNTLVGTLVNRKQESLGTKNLGSWTMTVTLSLS